MICVAGAGTINSSDGSFGGQNQTPFLIFGYVGYGDGSPCNNPIVNITNADAGWCADTVYDSNYYQALLCGANVSFGDLLEFDVTDGVGFNNTSRVVNPDDLDNGGIFGFNLTLPTRSPLVDVELTPDDDPAMPGVQVINPDYLTTDGTVTITANVTDPDDYKNITGVIADITSPSTVGDSPVSLTFVSNSSATTSRYTGRFNILSRPPGDYEVVIKATNTGGFTGTSSNCFTYLHGATASMSPSASQSMPISPVIICGYVSYPDGSACTSPSVIVTNLNTSEELAAENRIEESFYQLVTSSAFVKVGDALKIAADKNGSPVGSAVYIVNGTDIGQGLIEVNINAGVPDFTVTDITFDLSEPLIGEMVEIGATIANLGAEREVFVEFYDNKSINIERVLNEHSESPINDTITFPDAIRIRAHFKSFDVYSMGNITIHNESRLVDGINETGTDHWTEWCDGGTIRIESWNTGFIVDRYEAMLANESISLGLEESTNISVIWNLSDQSVGWVTNGTHNIMVRVDPYNQLAESDEANNAKTVVIDVNPSLDFTVTEVSLDQTELVLGDVVKIAANISNYGSRNGTTVVGVCYDDRRIEIKRYVKLLSGEMEGENYISTDNILLPSGVLGARLHFDHFETYSGHVDICDEDGRVIERIGVDETGLKSGENYWTDWIYSENITIRTELPCIDSAYRRCNFTIDRYEALIAEKPVTLNAAESKVINLSWRTGAAYGGAGDHNITVMVDPRNHSVETNETNNTQSRGIVVNGTDLAVTEIEIPYDLIYLGQDVNVSATIANLGAVDATNFTVKFLDGICSKCNETNPSGINFTEVCIERLNSGRNMTVSVIWNPAETGYHTITVDIPYDNTDSNETNNELNCSCVEVDARYDFFVESVNVEPQTARKGKSVDITATIGNVNTSHTGGNVSIAFFVNCTDFAGTCGERFTRIGTIDDVYLGIGETKTVSRRWDVDVAGGRHLIAAVVNPDNELEEIDCGVIPLHDTIRFRDNRNNVKNCTLHVTPLNLGMGEITLVPAEPNIGDIVDVTAEIRNNGGAEADSMIWFYMQSNESISEHVGEKGWSRSFALPPEVPIRFHFDRIKIKYGGGTVDGSVTDGWGQPRPLYFYVKCEEYGQDVKTSMIDYDSTLCYWYDANGTWRVWDDVWTDWTDGTEIEINVKPRTGTDKSCFINFSIDKYQVRLGNRTVTLNAGESGLFTTEWNTSFPIKPGKNYTILANMDEQTKKSRETYLGGTDLAVTNLSVKPVVRDGDSVLLNATIENLGRMDATAFIVNVTEVYHPEEPEVDCTGSWIEKDDHIELINTIYIRGLEVGNSTNISVPWNASIRGIEWECWNTYTSSSTSWIGIVDDYTINVTINPLENLNREENRANDSLLRDVPVNRSRDFDVTNLSFFVNGTVRNPLELDLYDDVVLNATVDVTNLANQGGSVDMSFYVDETTKEHRIGSCSIIYDAGNGTEYAEIEWKNVVCTPGDHNVIVRVDPENRTHEIDESNNDSVWEMRVDAPELVLESLDIYPRNPMKGEIVSINVTIENSGREDASGVTLEIYDWRERHIDDVDEQSGPGHEEIEIKRENATAMRLYLDLEVEDGCKVCINDGGGSEVICYYENFHGWTPWMLDNSTTIVVTKNETNRAYARVDKVYYLAPGGLINTSTHDLGINEERNITVNWNTSTAGERFIAAIIDPEDYIVEYDESNNRLARFVSVQTADLTVSNLSFWQSGVEIGENDTIRHGDNITIAVNIANIGVEDAGNFSVRFLIDDIPIKEETMPDLASGSTIYRFANWSATVSNHLIGVEVDWENGMDETNETNNIVALERYVCGAELSGDVSWETLGFHGDILFGPAQPYDEDEVIITATVNNSGEVSATNFSTAIFFNYAPYPFQKLPGYCWPEGKWINKTYPGAEWLYLGVTTPVGDPEPSGRRLTMGDVIVYDGNGSEVAKPHRSCSIMVYGDTVNVSIASEPDDDPEFWSVFDIYFYPIYQNETSMLFGGINVTVNSSHSISMNRTVSVGNFTIMAVIDPANRASEDDDHRDDNVISGMMQVKPTRDFVVMNVTGEGTNLSDPDTIDITAHVSNIGLRNGITDVSFVDCEEESRTFRYHYDTNCSLSYLPIPPDATLSGFRYDASRLPGEEKLQDYEDLTIVHRPGVDAIELHFNRIRLYNPSKSDPRAGVISVRDKNKTQVEIKSYLSGNLTDENVRVPGETAYIYTCKASFDLDRYTTEKVLLKEDVALNATKTWNESKNITSVWNAYTGDHVIAVTLDGDDRTTEIDESNNELGPVFRVNGSRDPAVVRLNITPEHPVDGDDLDITAVIANNGYKDASFTFDLWADTTRKKREVDESAQIADPISDLGDRIRYIQLLNRSNLTLAPGENVTVNAIWNDISVFGSPTHRIIAIVDPIDEIDEINESNNEIDREIIMRYPDFSVGGSYVPGGKEKPVVTIRERGGICGASDVTVRFEAYEEKECRKRCKCWIYAPPGTNNTQVHFDHIYARNGYVEVRDSTDRRKRPIETYSGGEFSGVWGPWVEGNKVYVKCRGRGTWVEIDKYRWGNVSDETIEYLPKGKHEQVEIPWGYECPRNINVTVDPDNNITELNEDNNNKTLLMYADLRAGYMRFVSPKDDKLSLDAEKFVIDGYIANSRGGRNEIVFPVSDFNVTLEFRNRYPNGTIGDAVFNVTKYVEEPVYAHQRMPPIRFEFDPKEKFEVGGNYTALLIADSTGDVCESNELYPNGEDNNVTSTDIYVHNFSGYTGGGELINVAEGEVHGKMVYTVGDEPSCCYKLVPSGGEKTVRYTGVVPGDAGDIEFARIFVYWFMYHWDPDRPTYFIPEIADVDVTFNGRSLNRVGNYTDTPGATKANYGYGLYSYDVTNHVTRGVNVATVRNNAEWGMGVQAISLLVVYEDCDKPFTKYWINEGADIVMAANDAYPTGLPSGDCITTAAFGDVEQNDTENVTATLLTVLGFYKKYGKSRSDILDALKFNDQSIGSLVCEGVECGYWGYHYSGTGLGLTKNGWEDVTDHLKCGNNIVNIHSKGNYMMPANAFLRLIFPPDLNMINLTAPASTVVGAHHPINVTIRNDGRSDAHDFNVTLHIDGKQMVRIPHLNLPAGNSTTLHLYNWTPMMLGHVYNLTAAADVLSGEDWTEIETENNAMTKYVMIEEGGFGNQTGPRGIGGGSNPTGGEYTERITGRVMQGMKEFLSFGGGGGAGMFSLTEWIMKGAVWLTLLLFVFLGYFMEQRSYGRVSAGYAGAL